MPSSSSSPSSSPTESSSKRKKKSSLKSSRKNGSDGANSPESPTRRVSKQVSYADAVEDSSASNDEEQQEQFVDPEQRPTSGSDDDDRKKRKNKKDKKNKKKSDRDPAGHSIQGGEETYNEDTNDRLSFRSRMANSFSKQGGGSSRKSMAGSDEDDEEELFDDTFTFLMTAKYPLEECLCSKKKEADPNPADETNMEFEFFTSTMKFQQTDPDRLCLPFWLGFFVIVSQLFIYTIVIGRLFQSPIPPNADAWLRMAQIFAVIVTLYTQSDFIDGIFLLTERWKAFAEISTAFKFNLHALSRILVGNIGIISTFLLVMYSTEVIDLLLNFTAMEFVATLDDSAFELAAKGFLGGTLERKVDIIRAFRYTPRNRARRRRSRLVLFLFYFVLIFSAFFAIIILQQQRSVGIENEVYIQFDDRRLESLTGVSGVYKGCKGFSTNGDDGLRSGTGDIGYIDVSLPCSEVFESTDRKKKIIPAMTFVYCRGRDGWVYLDKSTDTPCAIGHHLMRSFLDEDSIPAHAFDILTHSKANWVLNKPDDIGGEAILSNFLIKSAESIPKEFVFCGADGGGLIRTDKAQGKQRPFEALPETSLYYPIYEEFDSEDENDLIYPKVFGQAFRPLYVREVHQNRTEGQLHPLYQVILYDGLRWNRIYLNPMQFARNITKEDECDSADPACWRVFMKYFHSESAWRTNITIALFDSISDPVMILSPTDNGIPTSQDPEWKWYDTRVDALGRVRPDRPKVEVDDFGNSIGFGLECKVEFGLECGGDEAELRINFKTDMFPTESFIYAFVGQNVTDIGEKDMASRLSGLESTTKFTIPEDALIDFRFVDSNTETLLGTCVPKKDGCIQVVVGDVFGDGVLSEFELIYDNDAPAVGGGSAKPFTCKLYQFGQACQGTVMEAGFDSNTADCDIDSIQNMYPEVVVGEEIKRGPTVEDFLGNSNAVTADPSFSGSFIGDDLDFGVGLPPELNLVCEENEIKVQFELTTDSYAYETNVDVFFGQGLDDAIELSSTIVMIPNGQAGEFEMSSDALTRLTFPTPYVPYAFGTCVPAEIPCIQVVVLDLAMDGLNEPGQYSFTYGDESPVEFVTDFNVFNPWSCRSYQFGQGCTELNSVDCDYTLFQQSVPIDTVDVFF